MTENNTKFKSIRETAQMGIVTEFNLRQMKAQNRLPGIYAGRKFLVNYPLLLEQLDAESRKAVCQVEGN